MTPKSAGRKFSGTDAYFDSSVQRENAAASCCAVLWCANALRVLIVKCITIHRPISVSFRKKMAFISHSGSLFDRAKSLASLEVLSVWMEARLLMGGKGVRPFIWNLPRGEF
ncbi:hypothetical protein CDAR_271651 [Caerostris darwini]|uniref:Uncharacterized protein n=1 Tax=Caerostris darwini TaxID=1538125 RepID=A0AAV4T301_9ARAC|nr:hypothetical protein CDAR_271651 [Caerostris darwini]